MKRLTSLILALMLLFGTVFGDIGSSAQAQETVDVRFDLDAADAYFTDDPTASSPRTIKVPKNTALSSFLPAAREEYTLDGWYKDDQKWSLSNTFSEDTTLKAKWIGRQVEVTLDRDDGSTPAKVFVEKGQKILDKLPKADSMKRTGYDFNGWFTTVNGGGAPVTEDTVINSEITFYAHWQKRQITVEFDFNVPDDLQNDDGPLTAADLPISNAVISYGDKIGPHFPDPASLKSEKNPNKQISGWYTSKVGGILYGAEDSVVSEQNTIRLYAHWMPRKATVTFDANGGQPAPSPRILTIGSEVGALPQVTKEGHDFLGWLDTKTADTYWYGTEIVNGDVTLKAQYKAHTFEVSFDADGGTPKPGKKIVGYGKLLPRPADPKKTGYVFKGWFKDANLGQEWNFATDVVKEAMTLKAKWEQQEMTVSFDANYGGGSNPADVTVIYGEKLSTLPVISREGYTFEGWYTSREGGRQWTIDLPVTTDLKLFARWKEIPKQYSSVIFETNGGWVLKGATVLRIETNTTIAPSSFPDIRRDGYSIDGWEWKLANMSMYFPYNPTTPISVSSISLRPRWKVDKNQPTQWVSTGSGYRLVNGYGSPLTGWQHFAGQTYYLDDTGSPLHTPPWENIGGSDYYFDPSRRGAVAKGLYTIAGKRYLFDSDGKQQIGWQEFKPKQKGYFGSAAGADGNLKLGWFEEGGSHYYADPHTQILATNWKVIDGLVYYFGEDGKRYEGLREINGNTYLFEKGPNKAAVSGWDATKTRYFGRNYVMLKGRHYIEGAYYLFNDLGEKQTGWQDVGTARVFFDADGKQKYGLVTAEDDPSAEVFLESNGMLAKGWKIIGGKRHYFRTENGHHIKADSDILRIMIDGAYYGFDTDGVMQTGKVDGSHFGADGKMHIGLFTEGSLTFYADAEGKVKTGWQYVGAYLLYFAPNIGNPARDGALQSGAPFTAPAIPEELGGVAGATGGVFYIGRDLKLARGWTAIGSHMYYFDPQSAEMKKSSVENGENIEVDGDTYRVDTKGIMMTGWIWDGSNWLYFDRDGKMFKGLKNVSGQTFYFDLITGARASGWVQDVTPGNDLYFNKKTGVLQRGFIRVERSNSDPTLVWFYIGADLKLAKGWIQVGRTKYYFDPVTGEQARSDTSNPMLKVIGADTYAFDKNGFMLLGFQRISGKLHYFNSQGVMLKGKQTIGNATYLFSDDGERLVGWQKVDDEKLYFDTNTGALRVGLFTLRDTVNNRNHTYYVNPVSKKLSTGWVKIGTAWYFFNPSAAEEAVYDPQATITNDAAMASAYYGSMLTSIQTIKDADGNEVEYRFNQNGAVQLGWQTINGKTYYFNADLSRCNNTENIGGQSYYFKDFVLQKGPIMNGPDIIGFADPYTGVLRFGLVRNINGDLYYIEKSSVPGEIGIVAKGMKLIGRDWYCFDDDTGIAKRGGIFTTAASSMADPSAPRYLFNANGVRISGWYKDPATGNMFYFDPADSGVMAVGEKRIGNANYRFDESGDLSKRGSAIKGRYEAGGKAYFYDLITGREMQGFVNDGDDLYYIDENNQYKTGDFNFGGRVYHFDAVSHKALKNGIHNIGGKEYYFNAAGVRLTGWLNLLDGSGKIQRHFFSLTSGEMLKGKQRINNQTYLFDADGKMLTGLQTDPDDPSKKLFLDPATGAHKTGLVTDNDAEKSLYYLEPDGTLATGLKTLNGRIYYFDPLGAKPNAAVRNQKQEVSGDTFYFNAYGQREAGLKKLMEGGSEKLFYFDPRTFKMVTGRARLGNANFFFNTATGEMMKDYLEDLGGGKYLYYDAASGVGRIGLAKDHNTGDIIFLNNKYEKVTSQWLVLGNQRYYFDASGNAYKATQVDISGSGTVLEFDGNGVMKVGIIEVAGKKRFVLPTAVYHKGWATVAGKTYYFDPDDNFEAITNKEQSLGAFKFRFDADGVLIRDQLIDVGPNTYYYAANGAKQFGFIKRADKFYYFDPLKDGEMAKGGWKLIPGFNYCYFNADGTLDVTKMRRTLEQVLADSDPTIVRIAPGNIFDQTSAYVYFETENEDEEEKYITVPIGQAVGEEHNYKEFFGKKVAYWYDSEDESKSPYDFSKPVEGDLVLVAKLEEGESDTDEKAAVSLYDGETLIGSLDVDKGSVLTKEMLPASHNGKTIAYWYTEEDGENTPYEFDKAVDGDLELFAKYAEANEETPTPAPVEPTPAPAAPDEGEQGSANNGIPKPETTPETPEGTEASAEETPASAQAVSAEPSENPAAQSSEAAEPTAPAEEAETTNP